MARAILKMLADSLRAVGAARSIVIDEDGEILAGNGLVDAAAAVGLEDVRVVDVEGSTVVAVRRRGLTAAQKRELAMYDNRTAELAEWDWKQLAGNLDAGLELAPWFTPAELAAGLPTLKGKTAPDAVPAPRPTDIKAGDVFALGAHRLLCGDSSDLEAVDRVLAGEVVAMVWGDPPYGIALTAEESARRADYDGTRMIDEHSAPWDGALVVEWIASYAARVTPGGYLASWGPYQGIGAIERVALGAGLLWLNLFTWAKTNMMPGFPEYLNKCSEHASIFRKAGPGRYVGPEFVRDYIIAGAVTGEDRGGHPSPKPCEVLAPILGKLVPHEGLVVDPFLGSGSTLIASEQTRRRCVGVELEAGLLPSHHRPVGSLCGSARGEGRRGST